MRTAKRPVPRPFRFGSPRSASAFLRRGLRQFDAAVEAAIPRVLASGDAEAVHDLRVSMRRLRTLLDASRPILGRFHAKAVRDRFRSVFQATSTLRDEEVLEETFAKLKIDDPTFVEWMAGRKRREARLRRHVVAMLRTDALTSARKMLDALLTLPVSPDRDAPLAKFAVKTVGKARKGVEGMGSVSSRDAEKLHELRIRFKKVRYLAEVFATAIPPEMAAIAQTAAQAQKRLGVIHDIDVAIVTATRARTLPEAVRNRVLRGLRTIRREEIRRWERFVETGPEPAATP